VAQLLAAIDQKRRGKMKEMQNHEIGSELRSLHMSRTGLIQAYQRKRSWRESEKALAIASVRRQMEALEIAYERVTGKLLLVKPKG
jgi:hypothetical protein